MKNFENFKIEKLNLSFINGGEAKSTCQETANGEMDDCFYDDNGNGTLDRGECLVFSPCE